ncbi:hypothetical protein ACROYT_G016212 [Oculina patagonica]
MTAFLVIAEEGSSTVSTKRDLPISSSQYAKPVKFVTTDLREEGSSTVSTKRDLPISSSQYAKPVKFVTTDLREEGSSTVSTKRDLPISSSQYAKPVKFVTTDLRGLVEEATVGSKCNSPSRWSTVKASVVGVLRRRLHYLKKQVGITRYPSKAANKTVVMQRIRRDLDSPAHENYGEEIIHQIEIEICCIEVESKIVQAIMIQELDRGINHYLSDRIDEARKSLRNVFTKMSVADARMFKFSTGYGLQVLDRGKEIFLKDHVSCLVKHGTLLLDSSKGGAQLYIGLLNVVGAFAVTISEYEIGRETFSMLISLHRKTDITGHLQDLGAAYNNAGCISLIKGDLNQAEFYFETSLKELKSEKFQQPQNSSLEVMLIAVQSNISRLLLMSRNFGEALEKQEQVVKSCKAKETNTLPLELVFTVLNNQAVLHTTLTNFGKAEEALKWLISYCMEMNREDSDFLLNFVSLHLCEVLLLAGKSKQAEKAFSSEIFKTVRGTELALLFGELHVNVRTEALEKMIDVLVSRGEVKLACTLLDKSVNNLMKSFGADHFNVASLLYKQGTILSLIGKVLSSVEKFKCSIAILENMFSVGHPLLLKCYMSLGDVALRLKRQDESYFYFQRAMEHIEVLYQVSFASQLSRKYVEITKNAKPTQGRRVRVDKTEGLVEDLVAEHGLAFAVLLSRLFFQHNSCPSERRKTKGKQPLLSKSRRGQCSEAMEIISLKYTRDFLQSGQMFFRQGMTKEATAFFQQAGKYCETYHMVQGPPNPCLARLYSVITKKGRLGNEKTLDNNHELINCLEELSEITTELITNGRSKRTSEDTAMMASDYQLNLKLVLIFLILLSIELKMIDTTFTAYDLYSKLSQTDESLLLFLNGGVQIYASRISITCNGKTAVQDVLVSSTIGIKEDDSECPVPKNQLFRSLACKKNVPTDNFLVTYNSSILLDTDDLQALERKISLSVQECFQLKCFETGIEGSATQVVVDLSSKSTCDFYDISSTSKPIERLSLCVSQEPNAEVSHGGDVSEISTAMCQKITCLTFEDEHTSSFIFSKSVLSLLQQYNSGKISTLSVEGQCLSMTVFHPVKARVTLWRVDNCIKQTVQLVQAARHGRTGWTMPQQTSCEDLVGISSEADRFSWPDIDHWAKAYHVKFLNDDGESNEPLDFSNVHCGRQGIIFDGRDKRCVQISSDETEEKENLRICLNTSALEALTVISDMCVSHQLYGDGTQGGDDVTTVVPDRVETSCWPSSSQSQLQHEVISSSFKPMTLKSEVMTSHYLTLEAPVSAAGEEEPWTREEKPMAREEDDDGELERSLSEKDRTSRRSFIAELQGTLEKQETSSKSNFMKHEEVTQKGSDVATEVKKAGTRHMAKSVKSGNSPTRIDITFSSFEQSPFDAKTELQTQSLSELWSHDGKSKAASDENALGRQFFENERKSRSTFISKVNDPTIDEISHKTKILENENSRACEKTSGKQDFVEDACYDDTHKVERARLPGASDHMPLEDDKRNIPESTAENVLPKVEVEVATFLNLCQSDKPSSTYNQTQHQQRGNLHEVHRPRTHTAPFVEMDRSSPQIEAIKDYASNGSGIGLVGEEAFAARALTRGDVKSLGIHQKPPLPHFPPPVADETPVMQSNCYIDQGCVGCPHSTHLEDYIKALFGSVYNEMDSMRNEYHNSISANGTVRSPTVSACQQSSMEDSRSSLLGSLQQIMAKTVKLIAVIDTVGKQPQQELKEIEKVNTQKEAKGNTDQEQALAKVVEDSRNQEESSQENEQTPDTERQSISTPVHGSPRPVCSHYQHRCLVRFPCCGKFYPYHHCHNESEDCNDDQAMAINARHIRCTICYHEQVIRRESGRRVLNQSLSVVRWTNKAKTVVVVSPESLKISVPPVSVLRRLTKVHSTVINAVSAGSTETDRFIVTYVTFARAKVYRVNTSADRTLDTTNVAFVYRWTNKAKTVVVVSPESLKISVPPVSVLHRLTKVHSTVINAVSAGSTETDRFIVTYVTFARAKVYRVNTSADRTLDTTNVAFVYRWTNKAKTVVVVSPESLEISVPPVSVLHRLTKVHSTVINAVSAGSTETDRFIVTYVTFARAKVYRVNTSADRTMDTTNVAFVYRWTNKAKTVVDVSPEGLNISVPPVGILHWLTIIHSTVINAVSAGSTETDRFIVTYVTFARAKVYRVNTSADRTLDTTNVAFVYRWTNKAKTVVDVSPEGLNISVPPVGILHRLTIIHSTVINAVSAGPIRQD